MSLVIANGTSKDVFNTSNSSTITSISPVLRLVLILSLKTMFPVTLITYSLFKLEASSYYLLSGLTTN